MGTSVQVAIDIVIFLGYVVAPISLVWGWIRWIRRPKLRAVMPRLSLVGFMLATASAFLAASTIVYAYRMRGFGHYAPLLPKAFRAGALLSLGGILFGIGGIWRASSLRWHAPVSGIATLAFWIIGAVGE